MPISDPQFLMKFKVQKQPLDYIYSCVIDIVKSDGTMELLKPDRIMPRNNLPNITKSMKPQYEVYYKGIDVDKLLTSGEFVHDLPKPEDVANNIPAYSKIILGKFDLNCKCNIVKQADYYGCDLLPSYLQIKPNPKYDIAATVNQMRNFKLHTSKADLDEFDEPPENNNNL